MAAIQIDKQYSPVLQGDVKIMFDKIKGDFWIDYPEGIDSGMIIKKNVESLKEAKELLEFNITTYTKSKYFTRDMIAISFVSSSVEATKTNQMTGNTSGRIDTYGCAVGLDWFILKEYEVHNRVVLRRESIGFDDSRMEKYKDVYGIKKTLMYEYIRGSKYNWSSSKKSPGVLQLSKDLFWCRDIKHILPYTEELEKFLVETETAMEVMVEKVTKFFHTDSEQFLEKVKSNIKLLE